MQVEQQICHYVNDPVMNRLTAPERRLFRPRIDYGEAFYVGFTTALWTFGTSLLVTLVLKLSGALQMVQMSFGTALLETYATLQLLVIAFNLKYLFIWFIELYQHYAKPETRLRCCYIPSCSEYGILALEKYGAIVGSIKTLRRVARCGPPGGIDFP